MNVDVTEKVKFQDNDGDHLPLTKCVCGAKFPAWEFQLGTDENNPHICLHCGRKLFFAITIRVYEVNNRL